MSYEMKDILKTMIDNNEPYWSSDTMDMVRVEIHNVYAQAAKVDEYEAKVKAFNDTLKTIDKLINDDERYKEARSNDFIAGMLIAYENIFNLMEDYIKESGESDAEK